MKYLILLFSFAILAMKCCEDEPMKDSDQISIIDPEHEALKTSLVQAQQYINSSKYKMSLNEIYFQIRQNFFSKFTNEIFERTLLFGNEVLTDVLAFKYANDIKNGKKNLDDFKKQIFDTNFLTKISKFYFLGYGRYSFDHKFIDFGTEFNQKIQENLKLSINDFLNFGKKFLHKIRVIGDEVDEEQIDLNNLSLTSLEGIEKIPGIKSVKYLNISSNNVTDIDSYILYFTSLISLDLANNRISNIGKNFKLIKSLKYLGLPKNPLNDTSLMEIENSKISNPDLIIEK